ncbi:MAG TPA: hypothetical protein DCE41_32340 [Cytophagales bacterium]|nr:hypothetical protein [Cytophagales bacterium]HAP58931.1 hypothetical protein [Cytophagales bacterium]
MTFAEQLTESMKVNKRYLPRTAKVAVALVIFLWGMAPQVGQAQDSKLRGNVGLHGVMLTRPGVRAGVEYQLLENSKSGLLGRLFPSQPNVKHRWVVAPQAGLYWDPRSFTALHGSLEFGRVSGRDKGLSRQWRVGPGFHYSFLPEVYEVTGNSVDALGIAGRNFITLSGTYGFGIGNPKSAVWLNLHTQFLLGYNVNIMPIAGIELVYQFATRR